MVSLILRLQIGGRGCERARTLCINAGGTHADGRLLHCREDGSAKADLG
jgi:hypothetical protein